VITPRPTNKKPRPEIPIDQGQNKNIHGPDGKHDVQAMLHYQEYKSQPTVISNIDQAQAPLLTYKNRIEIKLRNEKMIYAKRLSE